MADVLTTQVGGTHYKDYKYQPIEFFMDLIYPQQFILQSNTLLVLVQIKIVVDLVLIKPSIIFRFLKLIGKINSVIQ